MSEIPVDIDWSLTTWEGSRREQLRHALSFTLRERLQAVEDMAEVAQRFKEMRETGQSSTARPAQSTSLTSETIAVRQTPPRYDSTD